MAEWGRRHARCPVLSVLQRRLASICTIAWRRLGIEQFLSIRSHTFRFRYVGVFVEKNSPSWRVEIIKLTGTRGPEKCRNGRNQQHESERNEYEYDGHPLAFAILEQHAAVLGFSGRTWRMRLSRHAFVVTISELADIPIAAIHGASMPVAASGNAIRL